MLIFQKHRHFSEIQYLLVFAKYIEPPLERSQGNIKCTADAEERVTAKVTKLSQAQGCRTMFGLSLGPNFDKLWAYDFYRQNCT